eukprot:GHVU01086223.1.p1 GENE.GHVU01086223.1~~GHVU01086223.1.p1  ORF type:complete len:317 (-),score=31.90 GHVU01086223.1:1112-2062(-)
MKSDTRSKQPLCCAVVCGRSPQRRGSANGSQQSSRRLMPAPGGQTRELRKLREVDRNNAILLGKIRSMKPDKDLVACRTERPPAMSTNAYTRYREQVRIEEGNMRIMKRINGQKVHPSLQEWRKDAEQQQQHFILRCNQPIALPDALARINRGGSKSSAALNFVLPASYPGVPEGAYMVLRRNTPIGGKDYLVDVVVWHHDLIITAYCPRTMTSYRHIFGISIHKQLRKIYSASYLDIISQLRVWRGVVVFDVPFGRYLPEVVRHQHLPPLSEEEEEADGLEPGEASPGRVSIVPMLSPRKSEPSAARGEQSVVCC